MQESRGTLLFPLVPAEGSGAGVDRKGRQRSEKTGGVTKGGATGPPWRCRPGGAQQGRPRAGDRCASCPWGLCHTEPHADEHPLTCTPGPSDTAQKHAQVAGTCPRRSPLEGFLKGLTAQGGRAPGAVRVSDSYSAFGPAAAGRKFRASYSSWHLRRVLRSECCHNVRIKHLFQVDWHQRALRAEWGGQTAGVGSPVH